ncbi:MAG: redoxin domain-containing protein [candidate division Zixibacteria bacterium]|nr:redoxin domain-containing protein [candidate division Zixibacteria bacterium]
MAIKRGSIIPIASVALLIVIFTIYFLFAGNHNATSTTEPVKKFVIGATVISDSTGLMIRGITEQSPAHRAGLQTGDRIIAIDNLPTENMEFREVMDRMTGQDNSPVLLSIERGGAKLQVKIKREHIDEIFKRIGFKIEDGRQIPLEEYAEPELGEIAPDFDALDINGDKVRLRNYREKFVLLQFWGAYCGPCRDEMSVLNHAQSRYALQKFQIIGINSDSDTALMGDVIRRYKLEFPNVWEGSQFGEIHKKYVAYRHGVPYNFLISPRGEIVARELRGDSLLVVLERVLAPYVNGLGFERE